MPNHCPTTGSALLFPSPCRDTQPAAPQKMCMCSCQPSTVPQHLAAHSILETGRVGLLLTSSKCKTSHLLETWQIKMKIAFISVFLSFNCSDTCKWKINHRELGCWQLSSICPWGSSITARILQEEKSVYSLKIILSFSSCHCCVWCLFLLFLLQCLKD